MQDDLLEDVMTFEAVTRDIRVAVQSYFLNEQSDPDAGRFVWAYRVRLENEGFETVTLLSRHWIITDGFGKVNEVKGVGVVGDQPTLEPGGHYVYTSATPLGTATGFMTGSYVFQDEAGQLFKVEIPAFSLDSPHSDLQIN